MTQPLSLADQEAALRVREAIKAFATQEIGDPHPKGNFGRVYSINPDTLKAMVWYASDPEPVEVNLLTHLIPLDADNNSGGYTPTPESGRGARVWVEKINGKSYITAVLSGNVQTKIESTFTKKLFYRSPFWGQATEAFGLQAGSEYAFVVPNPPSDQCMTMGPFGGHLLEGQLEIVIQDVRFSMIKAYRITGVAELSAVFTPGSAFKLAPYSINPPLDFYTDIGDFDLEIANADFTSLWDGLVYNMVVLRIRRKTDNNPGANGEADGYRIYIRSLFGSTQQQEATKFFPFQYWVDAVSAEPSLMYGDNNYSYDLGLPQVGPYLSPSLDLPRRAQFSLTGGGDISWNGTHIKWSSPFFMTGVGAHAHTFTAGSQWIDMPPTSQTIPVAGNLGVGSVTVAANGIPLSANEGLYYRMKHGGDIFSGDSRFVIVDTTDPSLVAPTWILIAVWPGSGFLLKLGTGEFAWPSVEVSASAQQTIGTGNTVMLYNTDIYNRFNMHSTSSNTGRLIAPVGGRYLAEAQAVTGAVAAGGVMDKAVRLNGTSELKRERHTTFTAANNHLNIVVSLHLAANDYIEFLFNSTGNTANTLSYNSAFGFAKLAYIGPR